MRDLSVWAAVMTAALLLGGAARAQAQLAEGVAAIVNDDVISTYDVRQRTLLLLAAAGIEPSAENQERARARALEDLMHEQIQLQEAHRFGIEISSEAIDRAVADIARSNRMTAQQFRSQLERAGIGMATLRRQIEAETAWRRLIDGRYASRVRVSDFQVRQRLPRVEDAERVTLRLITAPASSRTALQSAQRQIQSCEGLDQAMAAVQGAIIVDVGTTMAPDLSDQVRSQIEGVSAGQASGIEESDDHASMFVVCKREIYSPAMPSREQIENELIEQELAMLAHRHLRNLRRGAMIITR